jgi:hypothetical protein
MIGPYRMTLVNLILSTLVGICIYIFKRRFPKKRINLFFLLIIISLLPLISIFRNGTYESGDLSINAIKTMAMYKSFTQGIFLPQWAGDLNATYGYPLFIFTYPLPYCISSFFHFLGLSFINSVKALLAFSFIFSGITMFYWLKKKLGEWPAFVASILYLFTPYHLLDMHFRVDIGETLAFVFIPLTFWGLDKIFDNYNFKWVLLEALSLCCLVLSHQAVSLFTFFFLCFYILFRFAKEKNFKKTLAALSALALGMLLSLFYWLPVIYLSNYTHTSANPVIYLPKLWEFFISPWRYGLLFQGPLGQLSPVIGFSQWIVVVVSIAYLLRKSHLNKEFKLDLKFYLFCFLIAFLIMTSYSNFFWQVLPFLKKIEFSTRLLSLTAFFAAVVSGFLAKIVNKKYILILFCIFTILLTVLNWGNRRVIPEITDEVLRSGLSLSTAAGEGLGPAAPKWTKGAWINKLPKSHMEILSGSGKIIPVLRTDVKHTYLVYAERNMLVKENTVFFPGWKVKINNKDTAVNYKTKDFSGILTFSVSQGKNIVVVYYEDTNIVKYSRTISFATFIFLLSYYVLKLMSAPKLKV